MHSKQILVIVLNLICGPGNLLAQPTKENLTATKATLLGLIRTTNRVFADNPEAEGYLGKMKTKTDKLDVALPISPVKTKSRSNDYSPE